MNSVQVTGRPFPLKHGHARWKQKARTYLAWCGMKRRCKIHPHYIARDIRVHRRWNTFEQFLADMGECPERYSLDRINTNGDYEPGNCRWVPWIEQANNSTKNVRLTAFGETKTLSQWSRDKRCNTGYDGLRHRIKDGIAAESAITGKPWFMNRKETFRKQTLKLYPEAFCKKLNDGSGYIVWPGKVKPRGFEQPAIGLGKTANLAWKSCGIEVEG